MSFSARVYQVMIISSGDVSKERDIIRTLINEWNDTNAYKKRAVLLPAGCDTFTSPEQGGRPQEENENQGIKSCDLLIGVFWTKIGSPTGESNMSTLEGIRKYIKTGKPAMLYFSNVPIKMSNIDQEQFKKLIELKDEYKDCSFVKTYDSISDFQNKLTQRLSMMAFLHEQRRAGDDKYAKDTTYPGAIPGSMGQTQAYTGKYPGRDSGKRAMVASIRNKLSDHALELLLEAAESVDGSIMKLPTLDGILIQVNRRSFAEQDKRFKVSRWEIALEDLLNLELIKDTGFRGEVFRITQLGHQIVDEIKKKSK